MFMNHDKWKALSDKNKEAIMSVSGERFAALAGAASTKEMEDALAEMKQNGVTVVQADPAFYKTMQDAAQPQFDAIHKEGHRIGVDTAAMLDDFVIEAEALK